MPGNNLLLLIIKHLGMFEKNPKIKLAKIITKNTTTTKK